MVTISAFNINGFLATPFPTGKCLRFIMLTRVNVTLLRLYFIINFAILSPAMAIAHALETLSVAITSGAETLS
jgi:hypothetical protein